MSEFSAFRIFRSFCLIFLLNVFLGRFLKDKGIFCSISFCSDSRKRICLDRPSRTLYVEIVRLHDTISFEVMDTEDILK